MRDTAIRNIHRNVVVINAEREAWDAQGNPVEINEELVELEVQRLMREWKRTEYQRQRLTEYPPLYDLADALYWQAQGNNEPMNRYLEACAAVKDKYPKGGTNA